MKPSRRAAWIGARRAQARLRIEVDAATKAWPLDPVLVNLAGYHLKNEYMLKQWDAIQAGRGPRDRRSSSQSNGSSRR